MDRTALAHAYRVFVDELAKIAQTSVTYSRVLANGHPVRTNEADLPLGADEAELKSIFLRLSSGERTILANALGRERRATVHDVAAFLEWAAVSEGLEIAWRGEVFGASPYETMHMDLMRRLEGEDWSELSQDEE